MKLIWHKSQSDVRPQAVDYTSSSTTVYLHRNVTQVLDDDTIRYEYEECKLTPEEFRTYVSATYTDIADGVDDLGELVSTLDERITALEEKA